jgi:hypothetical protein
MREGQRQTSNRSSSITSHPPFTILARSNNITSHSIAAAAQARIVSNNHNPKQRQQCDITQFLPHETDQKERRTSTSAARLAIRLVSSQEQDLPAGRRARNASNGSSRSRLNAQDSKIYTAQHSKIDRQHSQIDQPHITTDSSQVLVGLEMKVVKVTCLT